MSLVANYKKGVGDRTVSLVLKVPSGICKYRRTSSRVNHAKQTLSPAVMESTLCGITFPAIAMTVPGEYENEALREGRWNLVSEYWPIVARISYQ
jgi:hypothetical protein